MPSSNCQFHQEGDCIRVLVNADSVREEDLDVQIQRRRLTVVLRRQVLVEGLLQGQVDVGNSKVKIHSDYVEIKLKKANDNETWPQLMLGVPDMMTSLQRAQNNNNNNDPSSRSPTSRKSLTLVSPEMSPTHPKHNHNLTKNVSIRKLNTSLSNMVHNAFKAAEDEMRDTSLSRAASRRAL